MITVKNILTEYPRLDQSSLPTALKKAEFDFLAENLDLYGQDKTIDEFIDTFIKKLNELHPDQKKTSRKTARKSAKVSHRKASKAKVKPVKKQPGISKKTKSKTRKISIHKKVTKKPVKVPVPVKQTKPKKKVAARTKKEKRAVLSSVPNWLAVIRKFIRMANKEYSQRTLRTFLKDIQTRFTAKRNGSPTPHIDIIRKIQLTLVTSVNEQLKKDKVKLKANSPLVKDCQNLSHSYKIRMAKETGNVTVEPLTGLKKKNSQARYSTCNFKGFGVVNSKELAQMKFQNLTFTGKWKQLIGNPTVPFHIMLYGLPGSGKSSLGIKLAKYVASEHKFKVLFVAREEGISGTTKEKFIRLNAIDQNIDISENFPKSLSAYNCLVIDSVNEMNLTPDRIRAIQNDYPALSIILIFKATKEGNFLGQSDFAHLCQTEIKTYNFKAQAQKNRFGGNMEIEI